MESRTGRGMKLNKYVADYVVFDLETTGISWVRDEIIEISAIKVRGHELADTFSRLVCPLRPIPAGATRIHGITDDMVADEPVIADILPQFQDFIDGEILVGHNIKSFDLLFLDRKMKELYGSKITNDYIDTLYQARACLPELAHHRLTDLAGYFDISIQGAHRALNDCMMNFQCYEQMGKLPVKAERLTCRECGGELLRKSGRYGSFYGCSNYPGCRFTEKIK